MAVEHAQLLAGLNIPQDDRPLTLHAYRQHPSVGVHDHAFYRAGVVHGLTDGLAGRHIPQPNRAIGAA